MHKLALPVATLAGIALWSGLVITGGAHVREAGESAEVSLSGDDLAAMSAESAEAEAILAGSASEDTPEASVAPEQATNATPPPAAVEKGAPAAPPGMEKNSARAVQPGAFGYPAAEGQAQLERIAPKEPPPPPPAEKKPVVLARPAALKAGVVTVKNRSLQLAGLVPTELGRVCTGKSGREWPCGVAARTAMRLFLRNRAIACDLPNEEWESGSMARCTLGETDIGEWLVANGWAEAAPDSPFKPLEEEARKAGKGLFGEDPRQKGKTGDTP